MFRRFALLALLCVGAAPGPPSAWPLDRYVRWEPQWRARAIDADGLRVQVEPGRCGEGRPDSEACFRGAPYLEATVGAPGLPSVTLKGTAGVTAFLGIGKLRRTDPGPSAILVSESGGSAGCVTIDIAVREQNGFRAMRLSVDAGDGGSICWVDPVRLAWPRDLTGHGRAEFLLADTAFQCRFTSCAGSWYPTRVVAIEGDRGVDVSNDPSLRPLYERDMAKARAACEIARIEPQGACAGYAADAYRVDRLDDAWAVIAAQVRRGCRVPQPECGDINRVPEDFPGRLAEALRRKFDR
jgi:hypothetical protein